MLNLNQDITLNGLIVGYANSASTASGDSALAQASFALARLSFTAGPGWPSLAKGISV